MRFQELAGGNRLLIVLLAFPVLQQRLQHVQTVVNSTRAQQCSCSGTGDEGRRLKGRGGGLSEHLSSDNQPACADTMGKRGGLCCRFF